MLMRFCFPRNFRRGWSMALAIGLIAPILMRGQSATAGNMPEDLLPELREILQVALNRSPQMIQNSLSVTLADANRYGTDSSLWPSLGGGASYGKSSSSSKSAGVDSTTSST